LTSPQIEGYDVVMDKEPIRKYDSNGNGKIIHCKYSTGLEQWWEYDSNGNLIRYKDGHGREDWYWEGNLTTDPIRILMLATQINSKVPQ
jgi:hypothetical protein